MKQIPGTELYEFDPELVEMKARQLSRQMNLPYEMVFEVLDRLVIRGPIHPFELEPDEVETDDLLFAISGSPHVQSSSGQYSASLPKIQPDLFLGRRSHTQRFIFQITYPNNVALRRFSSFSRKSIIPL